MKSYCNESISGTMAVTGGVLAPTYADTSDTGPYLAASTTRLTVTNRTTVGNVPLVVKGMASQSGDLQEWQNSAGTVLTWITSAGKLKSTVSMNVPNVGDPTDSGPFLSLGTTNCQFINRTTISNVPLIAKGMASQTGDLQQWQDSTGAVIARIKAVAAQTGTPAAATDLATALTLVNDLRTKLLALGLIS